MQIKKKLYIGLVSLCVGVSAVGCGNTTNNIEEREVIAPNVYYLSQDHTLNKWDVQTEEKQQVEGNVSSWEIIDNKIIYTTIVDENNQPTEEHKNSAQNELYIMDLDGSNKQKLLGKEPVDITTSLSDEAVVYYEVLGKDDENVYFTKRQCLLPGTWGYNVVYRVNVHTKEIMQVSDAALGIMKDFTVANDHIYFTNIDPEYQDEWGFVLEVNCLTKETTLLTTEGRSVGTYNGQAYYVDLSNYSSTDYFGEMLFEGIALYRTSGNGEAPQIDNATYRMREFISIEDGMYSYSYDMKIKDNHLSVWSHVQENDKTMTSRRDINLDGQREIYTGYFDVGLKQVVGQVEDKIYYLEPVGTTGKSNLYCMDYATHKIEILEQDIKAHQTDILWENQKKLEANLLGALIQGQGDEVLLFSTLSGIYSMSTQGGQPVKLYGLDRFGVWEIIEVNGEQKVYFGYDHFLYEGDIEGSEPKQIHTNTILYRSQWKMAKDQVTGEEWLINKDYGEGKAGFSNLTTHVDVEPLQTDIDNVIVVDGKFIYDIESNYSSLGAGRGIYICDQEGKEEVLIQFPESLRGNAETRNLVLGGIVGNELYYGIGFEEQKRAEIYKYNMKTKQSELVTTMELPYDSYLEISVDEENIYVTCMSNSRHRETYIMKRLTGEIIANESIDSHVSVKDEEGNIYRTDATMFWSQAPYMEHLFRENKEGSTETLLEIPTSINKIRYIKK